MTTHVSELILQLRAILNEDGDLVVKGYAEGHGYYDDVEADVLVVGGEKVVEIG